MRTNDGMLPELENSFLQLTKFSLEKVNCTLLLRVNEVMFGKQNAKSPSTRSKAPLCCNGHK